MMKSRVRYLLIMLIFVVSAVVYIDRSNISIAGTYLAADYHISKIQLGWVFSAFLLGYAAFQIPAGWVVGKLGPRKTLTLGLVWWSVLSVVTALVPPTSGGAVPEPKPTPPNTQPLALPRSWVGNQAAMNWLDEG